MAYEIYLPTSRHQSRFEIELVQSRRTHTHTPMNACPIVSFLQTFLQKQMENVFSRKMYIWFNISESIDGLLSYTKLFFFKLKCDVFIWMNSPGELWATFSWRGSKKHLTDTKQNQQIIHLDHVVHRARTDEDPIFNNFSILISIYLLIYRHGKRNTQTHKTKQFLLFR